MAALPYMQLYVADYLADTPHLTTEEHGAYLLLLFSYWQTGKPLRVDRLAHTARLSNERWTSVQRSLTEFFKEVDGVWIHLRVEKDLEKVATKSGKNSEAGKASAAARALAKQQLERLASEGNSANVGTSVERPLNERSTIEDTDTDTDIDTDLHQKNLAKFDQKSAFDIFWKLYPRKVSKAPSEKKFMTKCKDAETFASIIRSVGEHIQHAWNLSEMQFIPHASAWLNQERWNDEVSHVRPKAGTDTGANRKGSPSLVEQVRQRGFQLEAERGGQARYGSSADAELSDPSAYAGIDWDGEFSRIDVTDGSIVGADD